MTTKDEEKAIRQDFENLYGFNELEENLYKDFKVTLILLILLFAFLVGLFTWEVFSL